MLGCCAMALRPHCSMGRSVSLLIERRLQRAGRHDNFRGMIFAFLGIQLPVAMGLPSRLMDGLEFAPSAACQAPNGDVFQQSDIFSLKKFSRANYKMK